MLELHYGRNLFIEIIEDEGQGWARYYRGKHSKT